MITPKPLYYLLYVIYASHYLYIYISIYQSSTFSPPIYPTHYIYLFHQYQVNLKVATIQYNLSYSLQCCNRHIFTVFAWLHLNSDKKIQQEIQQKTIYFNFFLFCFALLKLVATRTVTGEFQYKCKSYMVNNKIRQGYKVQREQVVIQNGKR